MMVTLLQAIKGLPENFAVCVVCKVQYDHCDSSFRGRLYAKGEVYRLGEKYSQRCANLHGMPGDLRLPLIGSLAFGIDAKNSEYCLMCSGGAQLGIKARVLQRLITVIDPHVS